MQPAPAQPPAALVPRPLPPERSSVVSSLEPDLPYRLIPRPCEHDGPEQGEEERRDDGREGGETRRDAQVAGGAGKVRRLARPVRLAARDAIKCRIEERERTTAAFGDGVGGSGELAERSLVLEKLMPGGGGGIHAGSAAGWHSRHVEHGPGGGVSCPGDKTSSEMDPNHPQPDVAFTADARLDAETAQSTQLPLSLARPLTLALLTWTPTLTPRPRPRPRPSPSLSPSLSPSPGPAQPSSCTRKPWLKRQAVAKLFGIFESREGRKQREREKHAEASSPSPARPRPPGSRTVRRRQAGCSAVADSWLAAHVGGTRCRYQSQMAAGSWQTQVGALVTREVRCGAVRRRGRGADGKGSRDVLRAAGACPARPCSDLTPLNFVDIHDVATGEPKERMTSCVHPPRGASVYDAESRSGGSIYTQQGATSGAPLRVQQYFPAAWMTMPGRMARCNSTPFDPISSRRIRMSSPSAHRPRRRVSCGLFSARGDVSALGRLACRVLLATRDGERGPARVAGGLE
ncbi:unnamed protein product [Diplocarpon coronariae]